MCLIVAKPKGSSLPGRKKMSRWFRHCPDGVGIAFQYEGRVRILKGAMSISQMRQLTAQMRHVLGAVSPTDIDIVIQFRKAVTGSVCPAFCHPFPITKSQTELDSLDVMTDCALAHNGVIVEYNKNYYGYDNYAEYYYGYNPAIQAMPSTEQDINDAQEFIKDYLVEIGDGLWNPATQRLIEKATNSKFALLSAKGIAYIGKFEESNGLWFSNSGYKPAKSAALTPAVWEVANESGVGASNLCAGCDQPNSRLYCPFNNGYSNGYSDDETAICFQCFQWFYGRAPEAYEAVF